VYDRGEAKVSGGAWDNGVPHCWQKRLPGPFAVEHTGHVASTRVPQAPQNLAEAGTA
jgi:hypothetical protein